MNNQARNQAVPLLSEILFKTFYQLFFRKSASMKLAELVKSFENYEPRFISQYLHDIFSKHLDKLFKVHTNSANFLQSVIEIHFENVNKIFYQTYVYYRSIYQNNF